MKKRNRLEWIDIAKGIGIICVVYAHVFSDMISNAIFIFHMPLFFFIGGYLINNTPQENYLKNKAQQLLIPYASYLLIFSIAKIINLYLHDSLTQQIIIRTAINMIVGGRALIEVFGVFWFVTCFFITQQIFKKIIEKKTITQISIYAVLLLIIGIALPMISQKFWLPLNINVVPVAIFFFSAGYLYKKNIHGTIENHPATTIATGSILFLISIYLFGINNLRMDMKSSIYGIPVISEITALITIISIIALSIKLQRKPLIAKALSIFGVSSMTIMFTHQAVHIFFENILAKYVVFALACIIPLALHSIFKTSKITSKCLLGETEKSITKPIPTRVVI